MRGLFPGLMFALTMLMNRANAGETKWLALNREEGCVPLTEMYEQFPQLSGKVTPTEILNVLRKSYPHASKKTFLDVITAEYRSSNTKPTTEDRFMHKLITRDNAYVIFFKEDSPEIILFSEQLCSALMKRHSTNR
ncbi:hypothetical protein ACO0LD_05320 [Undibacterium sp. Ji83W]|uniref:hypothetical protein n=1 Tax=Undibacterium sp. Ji83W TaxID=3413043 RepID=UPI003BF2B9DB